MRFPTFGLHGLSEIFCGLSGLSFQMISKTQASSCREETDGQSP